MQSAQLRGCRVRRIRRRGGPLHRFERDLRDRRAALQHKRQVCVRRNVVLGLLRFEPAVPHVEPVDVRGRGRDLPGLLGLLHVRRAVRVELLPGQGPRLAGRRHRERDVRVDRPEWQRLQQ